MPTIGRATIDVHYDGKGLEREAKELGEETGATAGEEHGKAFDKEAQKGFDKTSDKLLDKASVKGEKSGELYGDGFNRKFANSLRGGSTKELQKLGDDLQKVFKNSDGFDAYARSLTGVESETQRVGRAFSELDGALDVLHEKNILGGEEWQKHRDALNDWATDATQTAGVADAASKKMKNFLDRLTGDGQLDEFRDEAHKARDAIDDFDKRVGNTKEFDDFDGSLEKKVRKPLTSTRGEALLAENALLKVRSAAANSDGDFSAGSKAITGLKSAFSDVAGKLGLARKAVVGVGDDVEKTAGRVDRQGNVFPRFFGVFKSVGGGIGDAVKKVSAFGDGVEDAAKKADVGAPKMSKFIGALGRFDPGDNLGQLIVLLVALLPQVSTLAVAAGGGLLILAAGATAALLGVGGLVLAFSDLIGKKIKDLPAALQPIGKAFGTIKDAAKDLRDQFTEGVFNGLGPALETLGNKTIPGLLPAFDILGGALNKVLTRWLGDLNSSGFKDDITNLFKGLAPSIENIGKIASNVFGIVGQLIQDASGDAEEFTGQVADATGKFLTFLKSPEGKTAVHDFLEDAKLVLKKVGDSLVIVGKALGGLVTPKNIDNTIKTLEGLSDAAVDLASGSSSINEIIPDLAGIIRVIAGIAKAAGLVFDVAMLATDNFVLRLQLALSGSIEAVKNFVDGVASAIAGMAKGLAQVASGDFAGGLKTIHDGLANSKKDFNDFGSNIGQALGNASSAFDTLPQKQKSALTQMASNFGVSAGDAKEFGGTIATVSAASGVSIGTIAKAKGWEDLSGITGLSRGKVALLEAQFQTSADGSKKSLSGLASSASGSLGDINSDLATTGGKSQSAFQKVISEAAGETGRDLSKLSANPSLKDLQKAFGVTGSASKTDMADRIITSANQSGVAIGKLPPKIQDLINNYGDIPSTVKTAVSVSGINPSISQISALKGALDSLHDKTINVTQITKNYATGKLAGRHGGVMAGGNFIAGGEPVYAFANGGIVNQPTLNGNALYGEAGAEAIVPLTGALSSVDKSVRGLAAFARGQVSPSIKNGAQTGVGAGPTIAAGAIQVYESGNGSTTATAVLDRITARL